MPSILLKLKKQPFVDVLQNRCSQKFRKFHRKTPVLESLFNKAAGLKACNFIKKRLEHRCFPVKFAKFLRTTFLQNTSPMPSILLKFKVSPLFLRT